MFPPAVTSINLSGSDCSKDKCVESCEEGWEENGDHCYFWSNDKKNWTDAEDFCQTEGGHLASVISDATNYFVLEVMNRTGLGDVWIGGRQEEGRKRAFVEEKGAWKWVDCASWGNVFWASGEPNEAANGAEDCLSYSAYLGFKWNDMSCGKKVGFLCSKKICPGNNS